jgi:flavorubredoxin
LAFGSYGWSAGAVKAAKQELKDAGVKMMDTDLEITYVPDEDDLLTCTHLGQEIARQVKRGS